MKNLKKVIFTIGVGISALMGYSCSKEVVDRDSNEVVRQIKPIEFLKQELTKAKSDYVMVVAHRGYWHKGPENSMLALEKAVELGVDMVEVDVQKTKDGVLILMHDETLERTTNGKGKVSDFNWSELQNLKLRAHKGQLTERKIPTLEEVMLYAKGKILINIDKADPHFEEIGRILKKTGTLDIAVVKSGLAVNSIRPQMPYIEGSPFMAVISLDKNTEPLKKIDDYISAYSTKLMEISYQTENSSFFTGYYNGLRDRGVKIWMTPCSAEFCAGHDDSKAINGNPEGSWGWLLKHGATMLLTNQPKELIEYLEKNGYRD